jgi:glycosyltransferase involved in cell wall biosynthesis
MLAHHEPYFKEVIALDAESTDSTREILTRFKVKVHTIPHNDTDYDFAGFRNRLQDLATYDWVLHMDADELMEGSFLDNLTAWMSTENNPIRLPNTVAFKFPRENWDLRHYPDYQIRFLNRRYVKFQSRVHAFPILRSTGKPVDEPQRIGSTTVNYSQTIDHRIYHLKDLADWRRNRDRWNRLEKQFNDFCEDSEVLV